MSAPALPPADWIVGIVFSNAPFGCRLGTKSRPGTPAALATPNRVRSGLAAASHTAHEQRNSEDDQQRGQCGPTEEAVVGPADVEDGFEEDESDHEYQCGREHEVAALSDHAGVAKAKTLQEQPQPYPAGRD